MIKATDYIGSLILENDVLQFIQTAEGRIVPQEVDGEEKNEYQYHLKDHLGNVRTTFAVRDDEYATDFETSSNPYFDNYDQITKLTSALKRSGNSSHRLAGGSNETVGLTKSLEVSKGDKVKAEVYGKYIAATNQDDAINTGALITALVNMLPGGVISGEGPLVSNNLTSGYTSAAIADNSNEQSPRAYLNYIMLDKDFNYLNSGFDRLSTSAEDPGDGSGTHQKLSFEEILIDQDGYLIVFLSNESQQTVEVFWDDFRVDHHHNAVLQADDYYPFGLTFNSYQRSYSKANNYKYNGFEEQVEWGVYDYQARYYDPALGRFLSVDPLADLMRRHSPYNYAYDNPIRFTDPDGMMPDCPTGNCGDAVSEVYNEIQSTVGAVADAITGAIDRAAGKLDNLLNSISGVSINTSLPSDDSITGNEVMKTGNPDEVRENGVVLTSEDDNGVEEQSRAKNTEVFNADNLDPEKNISKFLNVSKNSESNYHYVSEETIIGEVWEFNQNVPGSYIITKDTLVSPKNQDGGFGPARTANVNERRAIKNGKIELNETKIKVKKN